MDELERNHQETLVTGRNSQNRSIKQILGHLIDSPSNNNHRIVHLQYQPTSLVFPNYATTIWSISRPIWRRSRIWGVRRAPSGNCFAQRVCTSHNGRADPCLSISLH